MGTTPYQKVAYLCLRVFILSRNNSFCSLVVSVGKDFSQLLLAVVADKTKSHCSQNMLLKATVKLL